MRLILLWIIIIILLAFFAVGGALYHEDNTQDIHNITNNLKWNESIFDDKYVHTSLNMTNSELGISRLLNIIYKGVDTMGYISYEVAKWGIEVGYRNPEWNYVWITKWFIIIILVMFCIPLLIIFPYIIAIFYILIVWIKEVGKKFKNKRNEKKIK